MISLACTKCGTNMQMDPAFAGGVCRCKHCGTIQTVPAHLKGASSATKKSGKTLYAKSRRDDGLPSSGLDQLAQAVASSGLSSERLRDGSQKLGRLQLAMISGAALVVVIACVAWFTMRGPSKTTGIAQAGSVAISHEASGKTGVDAQNITPTLTPSFCGVPIGVRTVIYLLDRGSGTGEMFSYLKEVTLRSAESLGAEKRFQIIFWNNGSGDSAFPSAAPTYASKSNVESARKALDEVFAHGQSEVTSALTKAIAASPDLIILVTGKGGQLNDEFVQQVLQMRKDRPIKINTFDLDGTESSAAMKMIAERTGGETRLISGGELKRFARE